MFFNFGHFTPVPFTNPTPSEVLFDLGMLFQTISISYIATFLFYLVHNYFLESI
ncbi:hypothetical protein bthur0011_54960 [Bacillus thuringiensis serovar huazhongensis BGSC 4BD1]|nr:hypothetical protein bthur0011_54960 [Bacillus thuringiensis serovar huazhongensis BGSC 4BD1]